MGRLVNDYTASALIPHGGIKCMYGGEGLGQKVGGLALTCKKVGGGGGALAPLPPTVAVVAD